jgi:uncharacterized phage protein gp47/JayE
MATFDVGEQAYPTKDQIRDQILVDMQFAAESEGVTLNVKPGSDHYIRADAFAGPVSIAIANGKLARAAVSPLTAQGDDLLELAAVHGVVARPATKARGFVIIKTPLPIPGAPAIVAVIPQGYVCTSPDGFRFATTSANTVSINDTVEVQAIIEGADTNQPAGTVMTWDSAAVGNLLPTCIVSAGELDGGADADDVETVRRRLLQRLAAPGIGGNSNFVIETVQNSSAAIQDAYDYPAIRGPGSDDITIVKATGDRGLDAITVSAAAAALVAALPGHGSYVVTTPNPEYVDIVFNTTLPLPVNAGGAGGGWRDASPWPAEITTITTYVAGTKTATVDSVVKPQVGAQFAIWDPTIEDADGNVGAMREYTVTSSTGFATSWQIQVQGGFDKDYLASGTPYLSAGAYSLVQYASAARTEFQKLGPGEKTANALLLPRSRRHPPPDVQAPMAINSRIITGIESQFPEIALEYAARYVTNTTTPITGPSIPATTADPPNIIVLKYLAFIANV